MLRALRDFFVKKTHALNTIYINPRRLIENFEHIQNIHPNNALFPVIKSNAYGHGLKEIAIILRNIPHTYICIDSYPEYKIASKYNKHHYLVLSDTNPTNYSLYNWERTAFVVSSFESLSYFVKKGKNVRIHIFINTGMNREGFDIGEMQEVINILQDSPHIVVEGIMSHLSHADSNDYTVTSRQIAQFKKIHTILVEGGFSPKYRHIGASAGIYTIDDDFFTCRRTGKAMYGYSPLTLSHPKYTMTEALRPCARITSTVLKVRNIAAGESVGYNGTWTANSQEKIALIPFGYYEGLPRGLSNNWSIKRKNTWLPLVGNISMNYHSINTLGHEVQVGDEVEIFGDDIGAPNSIEQAKQILNTINYEIMITWSEKMRREIKE